jgi:predicted RNA-binding protein with PIN domain
MLLLVDAYNVLKQSSSKQYITAAQREAFIERLVKYASVRKHRMVIVFDGGEASYPYEVPQKHEVRVIFSGTKNSADEVLKDLCSRYTKKEVALVSSDRQLCAFANTYDIVSIDSEILWEVMDAALKGSKPPSSFVRTSEPAHKRVGYESSAEIDALMEAGSSQVQIKGEDKVASARSSAARMVSKADKKLKKLMDKL